MPGKIAIVAGGGDLPAQLIRACERADRDVYVLALKDQADPDALPAEPDAWIRMGNAGKGIKLMREAAVEEIVLAGRVRRPSLVELRPDRWTAKAVAKIGWSSFIGDDKTLKAVIRTLENEGFRVVAPESLLDSLVATAGPYGGETPDEQAQADIDHGLAVLRALGAMDVGQAVIVQQGYVLGVEAAEGTDRLIARCAELKREGPGGVLVKACKPDQERRVDMPTIGPRTVEMAFETGLRGIAIEAGSALVLDPTGVQESADRLGVFVVGFGPSP